MYPADGLPLGPLVAGPAVAGITLGAVCLARPLRKARKHAQLRPQAVLVLGGDRERERMAARIAGGSRDVGTSGSPDSRYYQEMAGLPVYVSSGHGDVREVMLESGVGEERLCVDARATDTVTNFTTMLPMFVRHQYQHVLLVTSVYHMRRARCIANITLEGNGIAVTPVALPTTKYARGERDESPVRVLRDVLRSLCWRATGWTGASLGRFLHPARFRGYTFGRDAS